MIKTIAQMPRRRTQSSSANILAQMSVWSFIYYLAFSLYVIICFLYRTNFEVIFELPRHTFGDFVELIIITLLVTKFLSQRASFRGWFIALTVVFVGFVSWRTSDEGWLFWLALFVVCSDEISVRTLAGITFTLVSVMTLVTIVCGLTGAIENTISVRGGVTRQTLGFDHANHLGIYLLLICVSLSTLRFGKNPILDILLILVTVAINVTVANSRSSALLSTIQIVLLIIFYLVKSAYLRRILSIIFVVVIATLTIMSFYFMVSYDASNPIHRLLDSALSGRLYLANSYFKMQPLTLFGSSFSQFAPIYWENGKPYLFTVDNAFCHLILRYGIVPAALFFMGFFVLMVKLIKERHWDTLLFGLTLMTCYSIGEHIGICVECNFFLVAMGTELLFGVTKPMRAERSMRRGGRLRLIEAGNKP